MDDSHGPALQLSSSLSIPPPRVSDYCRLLNRSIRAQPYREMFNETFRKLRHYTFQNEEQFTAQCRDLLLAIRCVRRAEREGTDDEENDEGDGDADGDGIDSAFDLEIDLDLPVIEAPMSIREMSRGGGSTPRFADTKIQQWVRQTIAGGNSSLSGNHRPDLCVSVRYRGGSLISLVGEDAIFGRSSKRALNGEQLFQAVPSLPTRSGTSRTARPYDEELGRVWQKKFARIQLYLLSAFEAFGCRLGLLRIHDQYGRLFVQDQHTIIVESSADFLSQDPPLADVSAATLIENAANSRHLPHRWSSRITSLDPMVDIVALAYDLLLMVELAEPLPLLVGPELDEAMPNAHRFNTATHHGVDLYRLLIRDRGQSLLVSEHDSARAFRHIFAGTDWTWDALEPPSSPRTSESDPSDHDGTDRTDGSSAHPGDNPGEDRSTPPNGSDQGRDEGTGQHEDPPSDIPPNDQGSSHGYRAAVGRPQTSLGVVRRTSETRSERRIVSGPPAGDCPSRVAYDAIAAAQTTLAHARESLVPGIDKASFLDLPSVRADPHTHPSQQSAIDRDVETQYEYAETTLSERDPDVDYAAEIGALKHFNIRLKLVTPQQMDDRLSEYRASIRKRQSAQARGTPRLPVPSGAARLSTEGETAPCSLPSGLRPCAQAWGFPNWTSVSGPAQT